MDIYRKLSNGNNMDAVYQSTTIDKYKNQNAKAVYSVLALLLLIITTSCFLWLYYGNFGISGIKIQQSDARLVCYYSGGTSLRLLQVPGDLCTHINIGMAELDDGKLVLQPYLQYVLQYESAAFHAKYPKVKQLLWIGGAGPSSREFSKMIVNHEKRKTFLRSVREVLNSYAALNGIDIDWEFPSAYNKERQHFSQLLYEIRQEWRREKRTSHLLSLAVAAPEGIALFAYDIEQINLYVDYVNLMTYDFHFYHKSTPFTGLNAPLYARKNERSIMGTFNINYTVNWWLRNGLERKRLVIGLPTYGHSFTLVYAFDTRVGAAASDFGHCGQLGFTTHSETCDCAVNLRLTSYQYNTETCSPVLSGLQEWISFENKKSIACKAEYIKSLNVGGAMVFSLNSDDINNSCGYYPKTNDGVPTFPLTKTAKDIIIGNEKKIVGI